MAGAAAVPAVTTPETDPKPATTPAVTSPPVAPATVTETEPGPETASATPATPPETGAVRAEETPAPPPAAATPEPAPEAPVAGTESESQALQAAAVRELDAGVDWSACGPVRTAPTFLGPWGDAGTPDMAEAEADAAELDQAAGTARLSGDVHFRYGPQTLDAAQVEYNRGTDTLTAAGQVLLQRPEARVLGERAEVRLTQGQATLEGVEYRVPEAHARGTAALAELLGSGRSRYHDISYTTCRPGNDDWVLTAGELELDQREGVGTARRAKLSFLGMPVAYLPTFTFPIDERRRSGVLVPSIGHSTNTGLDVSVPYYLNLAPNYDATLVPRYMSRHGLSLGTEFRFLTPHHEGQLAGEILVHDSAFEDGATRGTLSLHSHSEWGARLEGNVRANYASDSRYFEDLGKSLAVTSARQLERTGELRYHGNTWELLGRVQHYQTLDQDIGVADRPYSRYPQVQFTLEQPDGVAGLTYHLLGEYDYFFKEDAVRGHRIDLYPSISLPLRRSWGYVEPTLGARYTAYRLQDAASAGLSDDAPDRTLGIFSLDSGLYFDRRTELFGGNVRQTLEPRLYYLYVPRTGQDDQPVFDTTALDFNFDNLFRNNRYNGPDRQGDANQLTLALVSRTLNDSTGEEVLRAAVGQVFYLRDRSVTLPGETNNNDSTSSLVTELSARINRNWSTRAGLQWDPDDNAGDITQALAQVNYRDANRRVFNAAYRLRKGEVDQTDLAGLWPVSASTSLIARWNYSLLDDQTLEALAGIQYGRCCWRVRAMLRRYANSPDSHNLAFLLQLELFGLGRLGDDIDDYLERGIYGYREKAYEY